VRWAVLVGGTGSNLEAILKSGLPVHLVISHRAGVRALQIAEDYGVATRVILGKEYRDRDAYDEVLRRTLTEYAIDQVAMAGFLRWLTEATIQAFPGAILNLHPSLLPSYLGLEAIERAYRERVLWTGVSVHFVDEGHDTGPIVAQVPVPRWPNDALEDLKQRIHVAEHEIYPRVLHAVDSGAITLRNGQVEYSKEVEEWSHGISSVLAIKADLSR